MSLELRNKKRGMIQRQTIKLGSNIRANRGYLQKKVNMSVNRKQSKYV